MADIKSLPECPMAGMCAGMMETRTSRGGTTLVGLFFIALGVVAIIQPKVLVVLLSALFIVFGMGLILWVNRPRQPMKPAG